MYSLTYITNFYFCECHDLLNKNLEAPKQDLPNCPSTE